MYIQAILIMTNIQNLLSIALNNVEQMFEDRNYIPISGIFPESDIVERMNNRKYLTPSGKFSMVAIVDSTSNIKNYSKLIDDECYETILFVYMNNVTVSHRAIEKNLNHKIEIWSIYNLLVNVSRHKYQPKLELAYNVSIKGRLPKISFLDPIIRYYRYKSKDIIKITTVDGDIQYRVVS